MFKQAFRALAVAAMMSMVMAAEIEYNPDGTPKRPTAGYIPKTWPSVVAIVLFAVSGGLQWVHWARMGRQKYLLTLTIGMTTMVLGYILRIVYANLSPYGVPLYAITTLLILLSPCAFLALNYMLLTRLSLSLGEDITKRCLILPVHIVVKLFVWLDVAVFLLQASGGGLSSTAGPSQKIGDHISLAGLIVQVISYCCFFIMFLIFLARVRKEYPEKWSSSTGTGFVSTFFSSLSLWKKTPISDWRVLAAAMVLSSIGIIVRIVFRVAEFAGGYSSYLATTEGYFFLLDGLPIWLAMTVYCFIWPARCINPANGSSNSTLTAHYNNAESQVEMGGVRSHGSEPKYGY